MFKYFKKIFNFYMFYIQPLLGCYLAFSGIWELSSTDLQEYCSTKNTDFCSLSDFITRPAICLITGTIIMILWSVEVRKRNNEKNEHVKSGVKPEDFVK